MKKFATLFVFMVSASSAFAGTTVFIADRMLDVEQGKMIPNAAIVVQDDKIVQAGTRKNIRFDKDAKIVELGDYTLLPGLMDMHVHLTSDATKHGYKRLADSLPRITLTGVKHAEATLMAGFTTVRNVGAPGFADNAGVKMVFGTDAGVYPHGDNGKQFARMVRFGMTPMQAIQAATIHPAKLLKQEDKLGSLSAGKVADIVGVKGNPLDDISLLENVGLVVKDGQIVKTVAM